MGGWRCITERKGAYLRGVEEKCFLLLTAESKDGRMPRERKAGKGNTVMEKDPKKVAAGKIGAAKRWAAANGGVRKKTSMHRLLDADVEYLDTLGFPSRVEAVHAIVEFYRANAGKPAAAQNETKKISVSAPASRRQPTAARPRRLRPAGAK